MQSKACDARTKLEAEAYVAWIQGTLNFELSLWKAAAESLKHAQVVYENLMNALPEEEQTLYKTKVSTKERTFISIVTRYNTRG